MRMSGLGDGPGPDDRAAELLRVDKYYCLRCQCSGGGGSGGGQVCADGGGRVSINWHGKRSPEEVHASAGERWRVVGIPSKFRRAVVSGSPPAVRKRAVAVRGVERPDVEILDAVLLVHVMEGGTLAQSPAQQSASVAPGSVWMAAKYSGLGLSCQSRQAVEVGPVDARQ